VRARLRLLFNRRSSEDRIDSEFQFHIEMETERLVRELALHPVEARRRALVAFGGMDKHREVLRDGRGTAWLGGLSLDFRLGLRMLAKYPGLTIVGVLGISVAVTIGALAFSAVAAVTGTELPLDEGERVVSIQNVDLRDPEEGRRTHLHDLADWRESLSAVENLGAFRTLQQNLSADDRPPVSVRVAEMTASGFRVARVAPALGRYLIVADEQIGAPPVMVIGHDLWRNRFDSRQDVVGTMVRLGTVAHTVVGVMPEGFAFPVNDQLWVPLRIDPAAYERAEAPAVEVFGRLAPGASLAAAHHQLTAIGQRLTAAHPATHEHIRPRILPYAQLPLDALAREIDGRTNRLARLLHLGQVGVGLLLVVIGVNVAVLVYARTASRTGELAMRTALGASRRRIVTQLYAEALVLSGIASFVGIVVAHFVFQRVEAMVRQSADDYIPFWIRLEITPGVVMYVAGLAILAAVIIGVIPGLKATQHRVSDNLKQIAGGSSMQLGRTWTVLLVAQVAVSVTALPLALTGGARLARLLVDDRSTPITTSFVIATPVLERSAAAPPGYTDRVADLVRRLESESGNFEVVVMSASPGAASYLRIEIDQRGSNAVADSAARISDGGVGAAWVDAEFFDAFEIRVLTGRVFSAADLGEAAPAAIVNRSFVEHFLGGRHALGLRLRPAADRQVGADSASAEPWWEIVGVVDDFPSLVTADDLRPKLYLPLRPAEKYPLTLAVRARTLTPPAAADRIREVAMAVDPSLRFTSIRPLAELLDEAAKVERLSLLGLVMVTVSVVLLSAAGIYALLSFTVARRRREIGIRIALGATKGRVLAGILSRALSQIGTGIGIGLVGTALVYRLAGGSAPLGIFVLMILQVAGMMMIVGLMVVFGPARRALRVQPTEALRAD
jgi:predicted permease